MPRPLRTATFLGLATSLLAASPNRAEATEDQIHVGAGAGYTILSRDVGSSAGFGGTLHGTYGLSDALNLMLEGGFSSVSGGEVHHLRGEAGVGYVLDVLEWVPYAGVMVGVTDVWIAQCLNEVACGHDVQPSLTIPLGLDYRINENFAVGGAARLSLLWFSGDSVSNAFLLLGARAEYQWEL